MTRGQTLVRERVMVSVLKAKQLEGEGDANVYVRVTPVDMSENDILRDVQTTRSAPQADGSASWDVDLYVGDRCNLQKVEELRIEVLTGAPGEGGGVVLGSVTVQMSRIKASSKAKKHALEPCGSVRLVLQVRCSLLLFAPFFVCSSILLFAHLFFCLWKRAPRAAAAGAERRRGRHVDA